MRRGERALWWQGVALFLGVLLHSAHSNASSLSVLRTISKIQSVPPFVGRQEFAFYKAKGRFTSSVHFFFQDPYAFRRVTLSPKMFKGAVLAADGTHFITTLPQQHLAFRVKLEKRDYHVDRGEQNIYLNALLPRLLKNYQVKMKKGKEVAGRRTYELTLRGPFFTRKLWVDREHLFLLREKRFYRGALQYQMRYQAIAFRNPSLSELRSGLPKAALPAPLPKDTFYDSLAQARALFGKLPSFPTLPQGFSFDFVQHSVSFFSEFWLVSYTDGLSDLRITVEKSKGIAGLMKRFLGSRAEDLQEVGKRLTPLYFISREKVLGGGYKVTVSGEFAESKLRHFLQSLVLE